MALIGANEMHWVSETDLMTSLCLCVHFVVTFEIIKSNNVMPFQILVPAAPLTIPFRIIKISFTATSELNFYCLQVHL